MMSVILIMRKAIKMLSVQAILFLCLACFQFAHSEELTYAKALELATEKFESLIVLESGDLSILQIGSNYFDVFPGREFWRFDYYYGNENYNLASIDVKASGEVIVSYAVSNNEFLRYKEYEALRYKVHQAVIKWETEALEPYPLWSYIKKAEFCDTYGYCGDVAYDSQNVRAVIPGENEIPYETAVEIAREILLSELKVNEENLRKLFLGATYYYGDESLDGNKWSIKYYALEQRYGDRSYEFQKYYDVIISGRDGTCFSAVRNVYFPDEDYVTLPFAYVNGEVWYH